MSAPVLETRDLTIRFGGHVAVDSVSCAFQAGTLTAIVGPNGAGKTTYFNLMSGQLAGIVRLGASRRRGHHAPRHGRARAARHRPRVSDHQSFPEPHGRRECPPCRAGEERRRRQSLEPVEPARRLDRPRRAFSRGSRACGQAASQRRRPAAWRQAQARSRADDGARAACLHVRRADRRHVDR